MNALPDGVYTIKKASASELNYNIKVNDNKYWQYHKNNGLTKISFKASDDQDIEVLRVVEGNIESASLINKAYIKNNFPDTTVTSGIGFYPYTFSDKQFKEGITNKMAILVLPLCLCQLFPLFLYKLVREKESKHL